MDEKLIAAIQDRQGNYEGLSLLLNCYDAWGAARPNCEIDCAALLHTGDEP